ncbi:phosphatidylinositol-specific phospholipase C domain-containing protein [Vibrio sp. nBUS_14]|uniref:phosphatidylinositol-specific phospholipase C domain-containing protein n=1 Tax=Vibrio sp. nBUS_14 TaxID=3395321 RepID=UPI003EBA3578
MLKKTFLFFILLIVNDCYAHNDNAYYHGSSLQQDRSKWQQRLPDNVKIRSISIPGTHGSGFFHGGDGFKTQTLSISHQLKSGIRFMDIRLRHINDSFAINNGIVFQKQFFDDILSGSTQFLKENPSEFILMRIKKEYNEKNNTRYFSDTLREYIKNPLYKKYLYSGDSDNPNISEVRGKIIFLNDGIYSDIGIDYLSFNIQDESKVSTNWDLYSKWENVKEYLTYASEQKKDVINYLSASGGSFPYFIVSGHSSPQTGAPRLLTTPGWWWKYPDFPRVSCYIDICNIAFEGTNTLTKNYILNNNSKYVGIIVTDFPGQGLIDAVINSNNFAYLEVFEHRKFEGDKKTIFNNIDWIGKSFNDKISSLIVPYGFFVKAYEHANFQGRVKLFSGKVGWVGNSFNDKISSLKLLRKGTEVIYDDAKLRELSDTGEEGFSKILKENSTIKLIISNGHWAPHFSLPFKSNRGDKVIFDSSADLRLTIYYNDKSIELNKNHKLTFVYDDVWHISK